MRITITVIAAITIFAFNSCTDNNNPVYPSDGNNYLGGVGTKRTYKSTERWFQPHTDIPYFTVPDSLKDKLSLTIEEQQSGVASITNYTESVEPISDVFYDSWRLTRPKSEYLQTEGHGQSYSLENELDSLEQNKSYSPGNIMYGQDIYRIAHDGIMTVLPYDLQSIFPSVVYIKDFLKVDDNWVRYKFIDTVTNSTIYETVATVTSKENINIAAGTFNAFKIKLTTYHYNPDYTNEGGYEYYVPKVGLVLKESDQDLYQWDSESNNTIHFRKILRKELVSYNFVQ